MRIDKYLEDSLLISKKEAKTLIKSGHVYINGSVIKDCGFHVEEKSEVVLNGEEISYKHFRYYVMNKPQGIITATSDTSQKTVLDILKPELRKGISPIGRLDKDTEGLLLLTNDGELNHKLLSPRKHVEKTYNCLLAKDINENDIVALENGIDIGEKELTLPAKVSVITPKQVYLTITEGRYHQVKRMFQSLGNKVTYLERISFGPLKLDDLNLQRGCYRELSDNELKTLTDLFN